MSTSFRADVLRNKFFQHRRISGEIGRWFVDNLCSIIHAPNTNCSVKRRGLRKLQCFICCQIATLRLQRIERCLRQTGPIFWKFCD